MPASASAIAFSAPVTAAITTGGIGEGSTQFGVGDLNGDGRADVVVGSNRQLNGDPYPAETRGEVQVYWGEADGSVSGPTLLPAPAPADPICSGPDHTLVRGTAVGDVNGDGKLDIAYGTWERNCPAVIINTTTDPGAPTFAAANTVIDNWVGSGPQWVALGDADGDGKLDLVASESNSGTRARIWRKVDLGAGGAVAGSPCVNVSGNSNCWTDVTTGQGPKGIALADLNGDQYADLVVRDDGDGGRMAVGLGSASGPAAVTRVGPASSGAGSLIAVGDLTGDGRADLVQPTGSGVRVMLNNGNGTFTGDGTLYDATSNGAVDNATGVDVADMDGDGHRDVVASGSRADSTSGVTVLLNAGNGTLGTPTQLTADPSGAHALRVADITGDGGMDVVTLSSSEITVYAGPTPPAPAPTPAPASQPSQAARPAGALTPPPGPVGVSINEGAPYVSKAGVRLSLVWPAGATTVTIANDGGFADARSFPVATRIPWTLRASGPEREPRIVYVRFSGGGVSDTQTFSDDTILDRRRPVITRVEASAVGRGPSRFALRVTAKDRISGVSQMSISSRKSRPVTVRFRAEQGVISRAGRVRVRVRDRAGNWSQWRWVLTPRVFGPWLDEAYARRAEGILGGTATLADDLRWVILNPRNR
ncbi:MAG: VCBS repeat-containing protein [Acidobacteria bacterium]|nr:VCBS repeat-containing protein [Acidobacteriota bacterium]